jgi:hypothetical protein
MYAIYRGHLAYMGDNTGDGVMLDFMDGTAPVEVSFGEDDLVVDATDDQVAAAREGRPIPPDPESDAADFEDAVRMLSRSAADPALSPNVRAYAAKLLDEAKADPRARRRRGK